MPRSLWVIEVLTPKVKEPGNEWVPRMWVDTQREARETARRVCMFDRWRVRRWAPVEAGR
jgi:hypothetical protein